MKRPIVVIAIGYIIGILMGLYCNISIALMYFIFFIIYSIIKLYKLKNKNNKVKNNKLRLFTIKRYIRYVKLIMPINVIIIFSISSIISNLIVLNLNKKYNNLYSEIKEVNIVGTICSNEEEMEYKNKYKLKVETVNENKKYKNTYLILNASKDENIKYGDKIELTGEYIKPSTQRNYKGFDYSKYLKTIKVYGTVNSTNIKVMQKKNLNIISIKANEVFLKIKSNIEKTFPKEESGILLGIMLGYTDNIDEDTKEAFSDCNVSHILAVSGMHTSYIVLGISFFLKKSIGKRKSKLITIIVLIIYMFITGFSPSIVRSGIMGILMLMSFIIYRKNDIWTSIAISILISLVYNPFLIENIGLILSYGGTLGILIFQKNFRNLLEKIKTKKKIYKKNVKFLIAQKYFKDIISVMLSAQIVLIPIIINSFNKIGISFVIVNILVTIIIGPIVILGFVQIILSLIYIKLGNLISFILIPMIKILNLFIQIGDNIPFNKIYIKTPKTYQIVIYYSLIFIINYILKIYNLKQLNQTQIRVKNILQLIKYKIRSNRDKLNKYIVILISFFIIFNILPKDLKIYFIDVGQGDSTLVVTPRNKTILIDGGGNSNTELDVGKKILLPYLLDRGITKIDYIIVSHFDQDHVGGLLTVIKEIKVKSVIIGKQYEFCENYEEFIKLVKKKEINVKVVEAGKRVNIEKNLYFDILWPSSENIIFDNAINNNSLVGKLVYKNFSMLFTGDIEEIAEEKILEKVNNNLLKVDILKVAHHGSKTSSTEKFLKVVNPGIALIGVGENNKFGHPNESVIDALKNLNCSVYRTDLNGEIAIEVNNTNKCRIKTKCN